MAIEGCAIQVVLKALEGLPMTELTQEVGGVLNISSFPIFEIWCLTLDLTLYMCRE